MKKILFMLFAFLFLLGAAFCACAEDSMVVAEGSCGKSITWKLYDRSENADIKYHLVFEGTGSLNGYKKNGEPISYATLAESQFADYKLSIQSASVGDGITAIGSYGLAFLPALRRVELPKDLSSIGLGGFEGDSSLTSIYRRGEISAIGLDLRGITSIGGYAFDGCTGASIIKLDPGYSAALGAEVFKRTSITSIIIPEGVTQISAKAFLSCSSLKYVEICGNPTIDETAFSQTKISIIYGRAGSSAERLAASLGAEFSTDPMPKNNLADDRAIAFGSCGDDVYWQIINEGTEDAPSYLFDVFGSGKMMEALDAGGTEIAYGTQQNLLWNSYVPYIKRARVGGSVTTLGNCSLAFLKQVEYIELSPDVRYLRDKVFESNFNMKAIYITGNEPIDGTADLSLILTHGAYQFDGCSKIKSIIFSEELGAQKMKTEFLKGTAIEDFTVPKAFTEISADAFENCRSLTTLRFFGDPKISGDAFRWSTKLKRIYGLSGGNVEAYAREHGIEFISPLNIHIYCNGELLERVGAVEGSSFDRLIFDGKIYMLYRDEALTEPHILSDKIYEDTTLYASPLLTHDGFMVRASDYHGLRSLYSIYLSQIGGNSGYDILELGALATPKRGVRIFELTTDMNFIHTISIVKNNSLIGLLCGSPEGERARFAFTATGFEGRDGELDPERVCSELYLRGFVRLRERSTGREYTVYTDIKSASLKEKCEATLELGSALGADERKFILSAASVNTEKDRIYTKDELMALMRRVYEEKEGYIVGQHCGYSSADSFASFIDGFYNETGEVLGLVALDQGTMNLSGALNEAARKQLTEDIVSYAKMGGIVSFSFHMDHPANADLYCRGELGGEAVWDELMTEGTELNNALMASLETARRTLQDLEDAGVPVLWRPLHEMNGGWFWWCIIQTVGEETRALDAEYFVRLWRYFYNYFEVECDLDNLIWVYSPNFTNSSTSPVPVMYCYPGDEYVDIVGCDWYTSVATLSDIEGAGRSYSSICATGKVGAITEYGTKGALTSTNPATQMIVYNCMDELETFRSMLRAGHGLSYVLNWDGGHSYLSLGLAMEYMAEPETLGTKELYAMLRELW